MAKGLPKALMSRVGKGQITMKRAWAIHKGGKSTPTKKRSSKRRSFTKRVKSKIRYSRPMARRSYRKKRRGSSKMTIPIAPILGLLAPLGGYLGQTIRSGDINGAFKEASRIYTGYDPTDGSFELARLGYGLLPAVAGFGVHKVAGMVGINRALGRAKVPLVRI